MAQGRSRKWGRCSRKNLERRKFRFTTSVSRNIKMQTELLSSPNYYNTWSGSNNCEPNIPYDPRYWSRADVATWLNHMATVHELPAVPNDRFIMNGKALCLMTVSMFLDRVPLGGKLLYKDFQLRLAKAMYLSDMSRSC